MNRIVISWYIVFRVPVFSTQPPSTNTSNGPAGNRQAPQNFFQRSLHVVILHSSHIVILRSSHVVILRFSHLVILRFSHVVILRDAQNLRSCLLPGHHLLEPQTAAFA